jgi:hypothetical protein
MTTIIAPIIDGTNENPRIIGPHAPIKYGPTHAPTKPATIAPAQPPGISKGDNLLPTTPITIATITVRIKERIVMPLTPFFAIICGTCTKRSDIQEGFHNAKYIIL